jgi:hypothetical protein
MVVGDNEINDNKNTRQMLAILIVMRMQWCDVGCIARWITSRASLKANGCRHIRQVPALHRPGAHHGQ